MAVMAKKRANPWAKRLKTLRDSKGLSQPEAARFLDIPVSTLKNWEQSRTLPPPYVRKLVERALNAHGS
jgi:DNA-binding transcriptional regulator YiaG